MTLIISHINKHGIIQMSDSNLSTREGTAGFGQKVFPIPHLNASVAYTGAFWVGDDQLDVWLNRFIDGSRFALLKNIKEFGDQLVERLNTDMTASAKEVPIILHVAGYDTVAGMSHATHMHISNCSLAEDGHYGQVRDRFVLNSDFDSATSKKDRDLLMQWDTAEGGYSLFANGHREGRGAFLLIEGHITPILFTIWSMQGKDNWPFRWPQSLFETASILKHYFELVCHLYKMSSLPALYVGGEIQTHLIPAPQNLCKDPLE